MDIDLSKEAPTASNLQDSNDTIRVLWAFMQTMSKRIDDLAAENKSLKKELITLKENIKINSKNSSLPPSKDKNTKNKTNVRRNAIRKKNAKKRGG